MGENEIEASIEDILTVQAGGRLGIPRQTLKKLEIVEGDIVFVRITKAKVERVYRAKKPHETEEKTNEQ